MGYFDNQAATKPSSKVLEAHAHATKHWWKAIDSCYIEDATLEKEINQKIGALVDVVGAKMEDFLYIGASEQEITTLVYDLLYFHDMVETGKNHIVLPATENANLYYAAERMKGAGVSMKLCAVNALGQIEVETLKEVISPRTAMFALTWAHPLTGVIQPIWEIADFCQKEGILLYVQAGDIFGKVFFRFQDLPIDLLSFEGTRFHGVRSGAGLVVKKDGKFASIWKKERERIIQSRDLASLMAMGTAAEELLDRMDFQAMETARLRNLLEDQLKQAIPELTIFGEKANRLPNVSCFAIPGISAELLTYRLAKQGIEISFGGGREQKLEYILTHCGIDLLLAKCAVSLSLSHLTAEREVEEAAKTITLVVKELKMGSEAIWEKIYE